MMEESEEGEMAPPYGLIWPTCGMWMAARAIKPSFR